MEDLAFITKVKEARAGIVQLICDERYLNVYISDIIQSGIMAGEVYTSVEDYENLLRAVSTENNFTIVVPRLLQRHPDFLPPLLADDKPVVGMSQQQMRWAQRMNWIMQQLHSRCVNRNNKIISVDTVPNDFEYGTDDLMESVKPILSAVPFISSHMAYLCGNDSIVIRDKELPTDDMVAAVEKVKQFARDNPTPIITAKQDGGEGVMDLSERPEAFVVGDALSGLTLHERSSINPNLVHVSVIKERDALPGDQRLVMDFTNAGLMGGEEFPDQPEISKVYVSNRDIPLLCQEPSDKPILTAENYCKWYDLFVLFPDGEVKKLYDIEGIDILDVPNMECGCPHIDHNYHPELFRRICTEMDWYIHDVTLEVAAGRWALEYHEQFDHATYYTDSKE